MGQHRRGDRDRPLESRLPPWASAPPWVLVVALALLVPAAIINVIVLLKTPGEQWNGELRRATGSAPCLSSDRAREKKCMMDLLDRLMEPRHAQHHQSHREADERECLRPKLGEAGALEEHAAENGEKVGERKRCAEPLRGRRAWPRGET